ncbi:hypothetical protein HMPREF1980_01996 [Actinomyces sp. oral taxon 172 str. F0311]|nr:hypothetical protein HMPREF1980_01996 [Actinomyces sp. oral taxon 172 str. F0311]
MRSRPRARPRERAPASSLTARSRLRTRCRERAPASSLTARTCPRCGLPLPKHHQLSLG